MGLLFERENNPNNKERDEGVRFGIPRAVNIRTKVH
jgi:hypothetical protein